MYAFISLIFSLFIYFILVGGCVCVSVSVIIYVYARVFLYVSIYFLFPNA